jgi:hypothetical protein
MSDITEVFDVTGYAGTQNVRIVKIAAPARQTTTAPARSSGHVAAATHSTTTAHKKTAKSAAVHHTQHTRRPQRAPLYTIQP